MRTAALDFWQLDSSVSDETLGSVFRPWDDHPIGDVNRRIAAAYSVDRAFVTTNGTTSANVLCCFTLLQPGDHVLVERDCHISVLQAISLIGARPIWITPAFDPSLGIPLATTPETVRDAIRLESRAKAAILTSPKYFGVVGQLSKVIAACHESGLLVLVDEAHGATFPFHPALPTPAAAAGADLVTQSTHKTTEALSQGSVVLINNPGLEDSFLGAVNSVPALSPARKRRRSET